MKRVGIIGTRRRDSVADFAAVEDLFWVVYDKGDWIISGGCPKGGDRFAEMIAKTYGIPILIFYPDWTTYGKTAGFVRNADIAKHSDVMIACCHSDRTGGTEHTLKIFNGEEGKNLWILT